MSSKYTFIAWEQSLKSADEKLVLLKLADIADNDGITSFALSDIAAECASNDFKLANTLTSLANQGLIEKSHVETRSKREIHFFKLLLSDTVQLPVLTPTEIMQTAPSSPITQIEFSNAPIWISRALGLYNIPQNYKDQIWQKFTHENDTNTPNLSRLERQFESWLEHTKQAGGLNTILKKNKKSSSKPPTPQKKINSGGGYLSTHDLEEYNIPEWAQQTLLHAGLQVDPNLFWEKFVVYYKSRANEYISKTQLLNKLRYWIVNEKQSIENRKQAEEKRKLSYQNNTFQKSNLSPSEEFREYLRAQGKKPNF